MKCIQLAGVCAAALLLGVGAASADGISDGVVKIGVLGDMSGVYKSSFSGEGAIAAVKMAVKDFGGTVLGKPIEVISADHQNKADIASATARQWIDEQKVDMITDLTNSAVALAVQKVASDKHTITMATGAASSDLTGKACTKYGIHYGYDTHALAVGTGTAVVKNGGNSWYFLTADYAFGHALMHDTSEIVEKNGGKVVGNSMVPIATQDFSSYLLQAQNSGAKVIGLANAGGDTVNSIKQAHEFGITDAGQQLAGLLVTISDVQSIGTDVAKGLSFTTGWYWNTDDKSKEWAKRFAEVSDNAAPTFVRAADYSLTIAYLNAIKAAGTDDADAVREQLGKMKIDDFFAKGGQIRKDGLLIHDMYLLTVKQGGESKWDVAKVTGTIPGKDAYVAEADSGCALDGK